MGRESWIYSKIHFVKCNVVTENVNEYPNQAFPLICLFILLVWKQEYIYTRLQDTLYKVVTWECTQIPTQFGRILSSSNVVVSNM
jgi:hypothetical protein